MRVIYLRRFVRRMLRWAWCAIRLHPHMRIYLGGTAWQCYGCGRFQSWVGRGWDFSVVDAEPDDVQPWERAPGGDQGKGER